MKYEAPSQRKLSTIITASQIAKEMRIKPKGINSRKISTKGSKSPKGSDPYPPTTGIGTVASGFENALAKM